MSIGQLAQCFHTTDDDLTLMAIAQCSTVNNNVLESRIAQ